MLNGCKNSSIQPSSFIKEFIEYYINDSLNSELNSNEHVIKVITKKTQEKFYIDIIGYEINQLTVEDKKNYGFSYLRNFTVIYYGDIIPQFTTILKQKKYNISWKQNKNIEYDPIVFRIALNRSNFAFIRDESYRMNSLVSNEPLYQIVQKHLSHDK